MTENLLAYVIAYCQEELERYGKQAPLDEPPYRQFATNNPDDVRTIVEDAIDAYNGGAR